MMMTTPKSSSRERLLIGTLALAIAQAACGSDPDSMTGPGTGEADANTPREAGGSGSDAADAGAPSDSQIQRADSSTVDAGPPPSGDSFFESPPTCEEGTAAVVRVEGTLDGKSVRYEKKGVASQAATDVLFTVDEVSNTMPDVTYVDLMFAAGGLPAGQIRATTKGWLNFTSKAAGELGNYCITEGRIGSVPLAQQPKTGSRFYFEVTSVQARDGATVDATCSGPQIPVTLKGCLYRIVASLPK